MATDSVFYPEEATLSALDTWLASPDGPVIARLYSNNLPYLPTRVLGDYVEAAFMGYAPVGPITWPAATINGQGKAQADSPALDFHFTGGSGTATVFGMYFTDDPPSKLKAVVPFLAPVVLSPSNQDLAKVARLTEVSELNS